MDEIFAELMTAGLPVLEKTALSPTDLERAAAQVHPEPTEAQKKSGNYRKGHVTWKGLPITIETAKGQTRSGTSKDGKPWSITMKDHYGYFKRTESDADGDHVDCFVNDEHLDSELVHVVNQVVDGKFDEHKVVLGCITEEQAKETYLRNYAAGWKGLGSIAPVTLAWFKHWLTHSDTSKPLEPFDSYVRRQKNAADTFEERNEAAKEKNKTSILGHVRDGYIMCSCGERYHVMPDDDKCPKCGATITMRARGMKRASDYRPRLVLVKRASDEDTTPFTVAVDLDGTLAEKEEPFDAESIGAPREDAVQWVRRFKDAGARIVIFTVRGTTKLVREWLDEHKVPYDYINENPDQPKDSSGKVIADVYWDDRAFNAEDPDEHGPTILDMINDETEGTDDNASPVIVIERTKITIGPESILEALQEAA